jgi:hypothetical protein
MHEHENIQHDDVAQILQQAQLRRSADLGPRLKQYFGEARQIMARIPTFHPLDRIVSVIALFRHRAV